jgi:hypothetical protein
MHHLAAGLWRDAARASSRSIVRAPGSALAARRAQA